MQKIQFGDVWLVVRDELSALVINPPDMHPDLLAPAYELARVMGFTHMDGQIWEDLPEEFGFPIGLDVTYLQKHLPDPVFVDLERLVDSNEGR